MGFHLSLRSSYRLPNAPSSPTAVAYFSVAKLDVPGDVSATGIASGKYGCHIDPSTTTMVQTGLTNTPVPNAFGYLGIGAYRDSLAASRASFEMED